MKMKASAKSEELDGIKEKQNIFWGNVVKNKCCFTLIVGILLLTIFDNFSESIKVSKYQAK